MAKAVKKKAAKKNDINVIKVSTKLTADQLLMAAINTPIKKVKK